MALKSMAFNFRCIGRFLYISNCSSISLLSSPTHFLIHNPSSSCSSCCNFSFNPIPKCLHNEIGMGRRVNVAGVVWIHSGRNLSNAELEQEHHARKDDKLNEPSPKKRKKLKGKRAVVRWLKFFRWKKKRDFQRMMPEEKILFKLTKARRKEQRLLEALKKIEPKETSETTHDPEILTPEEHFYYLRMGEKCKNYVPVGRRGVYKGVILNMHLHWKKHETLKVIVKTFLAEEVREIAVELARLSGGIVLDIQEEDTIIMYRGKNYCQPPTEIMSPRTTLSRKKALDKSKYRDALRAVRRYIPKLEQDLELLKAQAESEPIVPSNEEMQPIAEPHSQNFKCSDRLQELLARDAVDEESDADDSMPGSDSESLSDIFETDSDHESDNREQRSPLLDALDRIPVREEEEDEEEEDFEEHLRTVSADSRRKSMSQKDTQVDEFGSMILEAASLLRRKKKR